ncbi:MAG: hypothetical protein R3B06_09565 [Kofleriaceae bacterium]
MRLGEVLVEAGWARPADVAAALERQRSVPRRLGALLVAGGQVSADDVARALARQRGVPAALERHLAQRDPALVALLQGDQAMAYGAVPVAWSRGAQGMSLVVCFRDPTPAHRDAIAALTGVPIIPAVACEAVLQAVLAAAYPGITPAVGQPDVDASVDVNFDEPSTPVFNLVDLDDGRVQRDHSQVRMAPTSPAARVTVAAAPPSAATATLTRRDAEAALAAATERDAIADLAVAYARSAWGGAVVLVVREGLAVGHRGFGGQVTPAALAALTIPLGQPSIFATVVDSGRAVVGRPAPGGLVQARFLRLFEGLAPDAALAPVAVRGRVVNLVFAVAPRAPLAVAAHDLGLIAAAMGEAYERLILDAKAR